MIQPYMTSRTKQKITDKTTWTKIRKSELINDKCVDMYSWLTFPSWTTRLYLFHVWIYRRKIKLFFFNLQFKCFYGTFKGFWWDWSF